VKIAEVTAWPISVPTPPGRRVTLSIGTAVKRDAIIVRIRTDDGLVGYGEAHHGRAPGAIAHLVNTTIRELVAGHDATDVTGVWDTVYRKQLASHGMGAAAAIALSGVDMALWDIGDTPARDVSRVEAVREAIGDDVELLVDANTGYSLADARRVLPVLERLRVGWLEEPFPAHDHRAYASASTFGRVPLAAGENHYTRFEFHRLVEDGAVSILQPDLSKAGGVTEVARIAAMASAWKLPINPHTSMTGLNMAATVHLLAALDNAGFFEADVSEHNPFRDELVPRPYSLDGDGCVHPLDGPGLGLEVDEDFISAHPLIDGPCYV
jgi:L-alanine-DL-glutamate epimerase-like enolase superfamily enzyme